MNPTFMNRSALAPVVLIPVIVFMVLTGMSPASAQPGTNSPPPDLLNQSAPGQSNLTLPSQRMRDLNLKILAAEDSPPDLNARPGSWLGLATEEAPEVVASQLRLEPGVGLVITYVATNSPAAQAGLLRDDVLVAFEDQALVHPQQLRKLVQVRKEGDAVKLTYYRGGKRETVTVKLAKAPEHGSWMDKRSYFFKDEFPWDLYRKDLQQKMQHLQHSLGDVRIDQKQIQEEVRHSMDQARRAAQDALHSASNDLRNLGPSARALEELARGWLGVRKDATVTVNSTGDAVQTLVKADDSGIYVLVANPRKHLTVHDPAGKLVFDGEIETPAQQAAVPKAIWEKARPLVDKMAADKLKPGDLESTDQ